MEPEPEAKKIALPPRPKLSKMVDKYSEGIITNYYKINLINQDKKFYQFEAVFNPEIPRDSRGLIQKAFSKMEAAIREKIGPFILKGTMVWATKGSDSFTTPVKFKDDKTGIEHEFAVTLKKTTEFRIDQLQADPKLAQKVVQVLNSQLKKKMASVKGMKEIGRSSKFYDVAASKENIVEDSKLKVMKGFMTSIHLMNGEPYVLIDVSTRVLRNESLSDTLRKQRDMDEFIGRSVIASYGNYRIYKIEGIMKDLNPLSTFSKDGKKISYKDYYKTYYGVNITNDKQFLIKSSVRKKRVVDGKVIEENEPIVLVPELLNLTGMEDEERGDFKIMKKLANFTKMEPQQRIKKTQALLKDLQALDKGDLFQIQSSETTVRGYVLPQPAFELQGGKTEVPKGGQLNVRSKVLAPVRLTKDKWSLVYTAGREDDDDDADNFVRTLQDAGKAYGIEVEPPNYVGAERNDKNFSKALASIKNIDEQLIIVTLLNDKFESNYYTQLKRDLYLKYGVTHQNVKKGSLRKNAMSVASKILLQINAKMGSPLWKIVRRHQDFDKKKVVVGGMAIYHKLIQGNQSCAAFVGTTNPDMTKYYSNSKLMNTNEQRFAGLQDMVINWVKTFCLGTKSVPDYIIVFREGVGEGSIQNILDLEVAVVKKAVSVISDKMKIANYNPGVAFILVNRKINQRMFQAKGKDQIENPISGSVVGAPMSKNGHFEYFIVPQYVNQGTATPTSYNVIYNTTDLSEDAFYFLTFEQCFNYYNWQGAVRVPAPLMYADKMATLVGEYLKETPKSEKLKEKLYVL